MPSEEELRAVEEEMARQDEWPPPPPIARKESAQSPRRISPLWFLIGGFFAYGSLIAWFLVVTSALADSLPSEPFLVLLWSHATSLLLSLLIGWMLKKATWPFFVLVWMLYTGAMVYLTEYLQYEIYPNHKIANLRLITPET